MTGPGERVPGDEGVLRRRTLVPSARQRAVGDVPGTAEVVVPPGSDEAVPPLGRGSVVSRIAAGLRAADPRHIDGPKFPLVVLALTSTIATWDDQALAILAPEIRADFGFTVAFLVVLTSMMQVLNLAVGVPFGYLADRVQRVWMVRLGSVAANVGSLLQGLAPGAGSLVGARLFGGVGAAAVQPASFPLVTDYYRPSARARVFAFLTAGGLTGSIVGPLFVGALGQALGWRPAVIGLGALASVVSIATFLLREPRRGAAERAAAGRAAEEPPGRTPGFAEAYRTMASITTLRRFWYVAPFTILAGAGSSVVLAVYYAEVFVLTPGQRGQIAAVGAALGFVAILGFGPVGDRILQTRPARLVTIAVGLTLYQAASFVALAFAPSALVAVLVGLPFTFVSTLFFPAQITMISMIVPPRMRGLGLQTQAPWQLVGLLLSPVLVSLAVQTLGLKAGMLFFAIPLLPAAAIVASTASHIERDIRNAKADALAEAELHELRDAGASRLLLVRNLDVGYDGVQVLFGVDLDVDEGELIALLGTNGAGKSTLLRAIVGTQDPTSGAVFLDGRDITHLPPHLTAELGVVMMPGGRAVFPELTVAENLRAATWLEPDEEAAATRREEVLDHFPALRERLEQPAGTLSGGEQQMVALGQALLMRPRLLMIDELSLGLAPAVVGQLLDILREIHARGTTVLIVEQSLNVAVSVAERAVFMEKGTVRFDGPTRELLSRPELVRSVFVGAAGTRARGARRGQPADDPDRAPALEARDVTVSYGGVQALRGASLHVGVGEILGIIGPNGAGKTTLFDVLSGFVPPSRGRVLLDGTDVTALPTAARGRLGLARSFQNARLFPALTVRENIAAFMERQATRNPVAAALWLPTVRRSERRIAERVDGLIELLGLEPFADRAVSELSTGSRRVVDLACVMAQRPRVLLLDEPSSGLAQAETEALGPMMLRIVRELGCSIVVIEHDVPLVSSVADRLVAMELGTDLVTGTPEEVIAHPEVVRAYLSTSQDALARSGPLAGVLGRATATTPSSPPPDRDDRDRRGRPPSPPTE